MTAGPLTTVALRWLALNGPSSADDFGGFMWRDRKRGRVTSSGGGGDYAAQMLLGRLKKAGLVQHAPSEGSTRWELTSKGMKLYRQQENVRPAVRSDNDAASTASKEPRT